MSKNKQLKFKCRVERAVFSSDSFSIYGARISKEDEHLVQLNKYGNITLVGYPLDLTSGVEYEITASEKVDPKFGVQYVVSVAKRDKPRSIDECKTFLREVISEKQADELLKHYPNIVEMIVNNDLETLDLTNVHGIKEKTFNKIKEKVLSNFGLMDILEKYGGYGISINVLKKIFDKYRKISKVELALRESPYKTLCGISGIGFKTADDIILKLPSSLLGFKGNIRESRQRMLACMLYVLNENENKGHTKMNANEFRDECLSLTPECMCHFVDILKEDTDLIYFDRKEVVVANKRSYDTESYIAYKIKEILSCNKDLGLPYENYILNKDTGFELTDQQLQALEYVSKYNISMLSGGGGVGKTATTGTIVRMLEENNLSYILLAPTGKASDVMSKATKREAMTIHRGLDYGIDEKTGVGCFGYNETNQLEHDFVILDESSMVDIRLFESLLKAINPNRTRLLLIQDPAQIPSVSSGNCTSDMIDSGIIPTTTLDKIFRYAEGGLYNVATKVRNGERFLPKDKVTGVVNFGEKEDYSFIDTGNNSVSDVVKLYMNLINGGYGIEEITVMTHHNKGDYGTRAINKAIQKRVNPLTSNKKYVTRGEMSYIVGDRVMQLSNNYDANVYHDNSRKKSDLVIDDILEKDSVVKKIDDDFMLNRKSNGKGGVAVYNGNTGVIVDITDDNEVIVDFGTDVLIRYTREELEQLDLAYAINIFKMQGSASRVTIILTPNAHIYFMNRNLIYTAITRTEEKCYHFATEKLLNIALKKSANKDRQTFLKGLLLE